MRLTQTSLRLFVRPKSKQEKNANNEYAKTLNLPNPGQFELSMKKICDLEENIKKVFLLRNFKKLK